MAACPSCGSDQKDGARFCDQCGAPQVVACVNCGSELRPGARFCDQCGAGQAGAGAAAASTAGASVTVSERRVTSVLFGDLVGFTTLSEQRDKEDVRELLSDYFAQCRRIVGRYGGTIEKFIGDAVMAVWGVPIARDDDAERAVRSGLELVRAIEELGEQIGVPGLAMRVGIVTGEVAVNVGAQLEGMVAGDAVNTAARVQSAASPGEVWVDESTRLLTSGAITYSDAGSHELKGKAEPMPLWAVRAVVAAVGGSQRADGLEAPLTGRGREIRVIKEIFHSVQENSRPALVLVNGEPGLGKSRLGWEFEKYIDGLYEQVAWHSTRCISYGDGVAYWPIAEAVRGRLGLAQAEHDGDPIAALDAWLATNVSDETEASWMRPRILALLGTGSNANFAAEDLFTAWRTFLERAGGNDPVAFVVDDAQHADDGTVRFVEHVLATSEAPFFVLLLSRPGLLQQWPDLATNRRATVLHLETLEAREMATLLDGLVSGLPAEVRDGLVERAQGVPLYAIETVRSLIDRDLVVPRGGVYVLPEPDRVDLATVGAPASLQAVVAARLDQLPAADRRIVAIASVLGATFTRDSLVALCSDVGDLDESLVRLTRAEILGTVSSRLSAEYGQYRFLQDVVRQVAYNTQSRRDRKARHLAVAAHFAGQADVAGEYAPVMAQHYMDAVEASAATDADLDELRELAGEQLSRAATRATSLGAWVDAQRYLDSALDLASDDAARAPLHLDAAWIAFQRNDGDGVKRHAEPAMRQFEMDGDDIRLGHAAGVLAMSVAFHEADLAEALRIAEPHWERLQGVRGAERTLLLLGRAIGGSKLNLNEPSTDYALARLSIADELGDDLAFAQALNALSNSMMATNPRFKRIIERAAIDLGRTLQLPVITSQALGALANGVIADSLSESTEIVLEALEENTRGGGDLYNAEILYLNLSTRMVSMGNWARADELIDVFRANSLQTLVRPWIDATIAEVTGREPRYAAPSDAEREVDDETFLACVAARDMYDARRRGDLATAAKCAVVAVTRSFRVVGLLDDTIFQWPDAAQIAFEAGDAEALATLLAFVDDAPPGRVHTGYRAFRSRLAGLMAAQDGASADVESHYLEAIRRFEEWGSALHAARAKAELAQWLDKIGRAQDAALLRQEALDVLVPLGANGWLKQLGLEPETASQAADPGIKEVSPT